MKQQQLLILLLLVGVFLYAKYYYMANEQFASIPDLYDTTYGSVLASAPSHAQMEVLRARNPTFHNVPIINLGETDLAGTIYYSARSKEGDLLGYLKMAPTEEMVAKLIDLNFYEQELFGFSGWRGLYVYEVVALNPHILHKLFKHAIHHLKQDNGRYYLSILCTTEQLGKTLIDTFRFTLALKESSQRFYNSTLFTLIYHK